MKCAKCGRTYPEGTKYCASCGVELVKPSEGMKVSQVKTINSSIRIGGFLMVLGVVAALIGFYNHDEGDSWVTLCEIIGIVAFVIGIVISIIGIAQNQGEKQAVQERPLTINASRAEEIKKLKHLLDEGVITPEEFSEAKRKILDNMS